MKENEGKVNRRKRLYLCLVTVLFCCIMYFCHSCTPPDAVYAAESEMNDPVSTELTEVPVEGTMKYVSVSIPYELEGQQSPPETTVITLYDEHTESEYERELTYLDMKETEALWEKTFSFPITVSGYDADYFQLGNVLISKDEEFLLYADQILESMGLSEDYYHINAITWSGEPYEREGEIFREALAEGEKRIRRVDVTYGGEIKTPDTVRDQYISTYETPEEKDAINQDDKIVDAKENAKRSVVSEPNEGFAERIQRLLQEHITLVTVSSMFILAVMGLIYLWRISKRDTKKQKSKELS